MKRVFCLALGCFLGLCACSRAQSPLKPVSALPPGMPLPDCPGCLSGKQCVSECRPTTKVVYSSVVKEYCWPGVSLVDWFFGKCGLDCDVSHCQLHTKRILVKKVVPGPCRPTCVLKDAAPCPAPGFLPLGAIAPKAGR